MDAGDLLTRVGVLVSLATSVVALALSIVSERRRKREWTEGQQSSFAEIAAPKLANLYALALRAAPASTPGSEGRYEDWLSDIDNGVGHVLTELTTLKLSPRSPLPRGRIEEAIDLIAEVFPIVRNAIKLMSEGNPVASQLWIDVVPLQRRLLDVHGELESALEASHDASTRTPVSRTSR